MGNARYLTNIFESLTKNKLVSVVIKYLYLFQLCQYTDHEYGISSLLKFYIIRDVFAVSLPNLL